MRIPNFTAEAALYKTNKQYHGAVTSVDSLNLIVPQDCDFFKRLGCGLGPLSWCLIAELGGSEAYWNCVDKVSGGNCLDCIDMPDPRDNQDRGMQGYAGYDSDKGFRGYGEGLTQGGGVVVGPLTVHRSGGPDYDDIPPICRVKPWLCE